MSRIFIHLYRFHKKHIWFFALLSLVILAYITIGLMRLQWNNDIYSIFPNAGNSSEYRRQIEHLRHNNNLMIMIHSDKTDESKLQDLLDAGIWWDSVLTKNSYFSTNLNYTSVALNDSMSRHIYNNIFDHLPLMLSPAELDQAITKLSNGGLEQALINNQKMGNQFFGGVTDYYRQKDPLHFVPLVLNKLKTLQTIPNIRQVNGFPVSTDDKNLLLDMTTIFQDNNDPGYSGLRDSLKNLHRVSEQLFPQVKIYFFGATFSAESNKDRSIRDGIMTGIVASLLTLLILYYFYRRKRLSLISLLPSILGFGIALSTFGWLDIPVVSMAMASATIILAMGISYAIHLTDAYLHEGNIEDAIKSVISPLLLGNLTTIAAFAMLMSANSLILKQFGLLAVISLLAGVLTTLVILPVLIPTYGSSGKHSSPNWVNKISQYHFHKNKWLLALLFLGTIALWVPSTHIKFQGDLSQLNYLSDSDKKGYEILEKEVGVNLSRTILHIQADNTDSVVLAYDMARKSLMSHDTSSIIPDLASFIIPTVRQYQNSQNWHQTWTDSLISELKSIIPEDNKSRAAEAIRQFLDYTIYLDSTATPERLNLQIRSDLINRFLSEKENGSISIEAPISGNLDISKFQYAQNYDLFNRQQIANQTATRIQTDFNNILLRSALIVFFLLLIFYGRIELTILAFLPLAISWIWILGIAHLIGLEIHIVNLILCTFIFGLCDDYSIFIVDGLVKKYTIGKDHLNRDKKVVLVSVIVTMIGLSALLLGKHPAFHSFAILALIGLVVVLFVSLTLQPALFNFYITKRSQMGHAPFTLLSQIVTVVTFGTFILFGLLLSLFGYILYFTGLLNVKFIKNFYHFLISKMGLFTVWTAPYIRVKEENMANIDFEKPGLIISNHQTHLDLLLLLGIKTRMIVMTNDWVYKNPIYGGLVRKAGYLPGFEGTDLLIQKARKAIDDGYHILIFPEGTRSPDGEIKRFKKGAFLLANALKVNIYPVLLHGLHECVTKGDQHIKPGNITLRALPPITPDDTYWSEDYSDSGKKINRYMRSKYEDLKAEKETPAYNFELLKKSYLYKGPKIYWYAKIKTINEQLFKPLDDLIPDDAIITDLGCGYGMADIMLKLCSKKRQIIGVDYDEEKILVAQNNYITQREGIEFVHADIRHYNIKPSDVIILYDSLHYLTSQDRYKVLLNCLASLNQNGSIIIREGLSDDSNKHRNTGITEWFSTRLLGFNKTSSALHFLTLTEIEEFCVENELSFEIKTASNRTSNQLIILKRK